MQFELRNKLKVADSSSTALDNLADRKTSGSSTSCQDSAFEKSQLSIRFDSFSLLFLSSSLYVCLYLNYRFLSSHKLCHINRKASVAPSNRWQTCASNEEKAAWESRPIESQQSGAQPGGSGATWFELESQMSELCCWRNLLKCRHGFK